MESARAATSADLPEIVDLAVALRAELRDQRGGGLWEAREASPAPLDASLRALLERTDAGVFVGTIDDTIIGFATVEIEELRVGGRLGVVGDLYVDPGARAVGVGEALADVVVAYCKQAQCLGIDAFALPGARAAKNFFERNGFVARALIMHKKL